MNGFIEVIHPGLYSSIQDGGRIGFRKYGVPVSGAMDAESAALANLLLNNDLHAAVMEITMTGPRLKFRANSMIAVSGADISPMLNGIAISLNKPIQVKRDDELSFGLLKNGTRCYLAVKHGFQTEQVMNSYSYYAPITKSSLIKKEDKIPITPYQAEGNVFSSVKGKAFQFSNGELYGYRGPEFDLLTTKDQATLFEKEFNIGRDNNRMGYRLEGETCQYPANYSMLTSSVLPGTVQLTPSGNLIVLMRDCQTTGGYPRVLQLTDESINKLAQKNANDAITFKELTLN